MIKVSEMNGIQKIAYRNTKNIFNYEVGGWVNCCYDGYEDDIPDTIEEAKEIIYDETLTCSSRGDGHFSMHPIDEVRFAGREFIMSVIDHLFSTDGDINEIAEYKPNWKR